MKTLLATVALIAACAACPAQAQTFPRLESAVTLKSAAPDWDYVTLDARRGYLFIGRRGEGVVVYDVRKKQVVRTLDQTGEANHVVLIPEFDRGYTTNGDGSSTAFQLSTLKTIARIKIGEDADAGFYEPVTKQLAFTMGDSHAIAFLDARTGRPTGTLRLDSNKLDGTAADGEGHLLMALRDRNEVVKIDAGLHRVIATWKTPGCEQPTAVSYDRADKRIFVGCRGRAPVLAVMNAETGAVVTTLEIGRGNDGVVYDAATKKIYTSNGVDANLVVYDQLDADTYKLSAAITTRPYARTMAYDPATRKIYLVTAEGLADPTRKINRDVAPFYPNRYVPDTFTVLTYTPG